MKITVRIQDRSFDVEIDDLNARPIVAIVEGERFEVWPENGGTAPAPSRTAAPAASVPASSVAQRYARPVVAAPSPVFGAPGDTNVVRAPIPGVIMSIAVQPGDTVEVGQELCVLEAMKMKNAIRAPRAGEIGKVLVKTGEHVQHHDLLIEFVI